MIPIWREPEVVVRCGGESIVQTAEESSRITLADIVRVETPVGDSFWFFRPQMNGYNVHDGVCAEVPPAVL
jgi:hypothetical protein